MQIWHVRYGLVDLYSYILNRGVEAYQTCYVQIGF